jgi:hypothetical protein
MVKMGYLQIFEFFLDNIFVENNIITISTASCYKVFLKKISSIL